MNSRQTLPGHGERAEKPKPGADITAGRGNGPTYKKLWWEKKCDDSNSLATILSSQIFQKVEDMIRVVKEVYQEANGIRQAMGRYTKGTPSFFMT
jgi:hypothetical protein